VAPDEGAITQRRKVLSEVCMPVRQLPLGR
jgi:hypothetical protein